ncbi:hypothetical protein LINGRAHAP2_LOCUS30749, partial [Linum grandiflorum]
MQDRYQPSGPTNEWVLDSGCSNHMTGALYSIQKILLESLTLNQTKEFFLVIL